MSKITRERPQSRHKVIVATPDGANLLSHILEKLRYGDHNFKASLGNLPWAQNKIIKEVMY